MTTTAGKFTYWTLLGLAPGSDSEQLKTAFRREAMRWHPDVNRNDRNAEERFKWIIEAYKVLNDPKRRFEWEIAGRPSFEIKEFPLNSPSPSPSENDYDPVEKSASRKVSKNGSVGFTSVEKLLIFLISLFLLFFLNTFIL